MNTGMKLLNGSMSLNGKVDYTVALSGRWQRIPGNGAYVAHEGGLFSATSRPPSNSRYVMMECRKELYNWTPTGVRCWRYVRFVCDAPVEDLRRLAWKDPQGALEHVDSLLDVLSVDTWVSMAELKPIAGLVASKVLRDVIPLDIWIKLVTRRTIAAQMLAGHLKDIIPQDVWEGEYV